MSVRVLAVVTTLLCGGSFSPWLLLSSVERRHTAADPNNSRMMAQLAAVKQCRKLCFVEALVLSSFVASASSELAAAAAASTKQAAQVLKLLELSGGKS